MNFRLGGTVLGAFIFIRAASALAEESVLADWGMQSAMTHYDRIAGDSDGNVIEIGDIAVHFLMQSPPLLSIASDGGLEFDRRMPASETNSVVIFVSPELDGGQATIPRCSPSIVGNSESGTTISCVGFVDYEGEYDFSLTMRSNGMQFSMSDISIFSDGATHHVIGDVELFGAKFQSEDGAPLVFKVSTNKYLHLGGRGNVQSADGTTANFD